MVPTFAPAPGPAPAPMPVNFVTPMPAPVPQVELVSTTMPVFCPNAARLCLCET
jgi:hypothetical protein